jgi:diguanylate cyclase
VAAVIDMAHTLGLAVVAEGVERPEQLDRLRKLGCDHAQGWLTGRPMQAASAGELIASTSV